MLDLEHKVRSGGSRAPKSSPEKIIFATRLAPHARREIASPRASAHRHGRANLAKWPRRRRARVSRTPDVSRSFVRC